MADNYTTRYVFELEVAGKAAVEQARAYRAEIEKALTGDTTAAAMQTAGAAAKATDKDLTSLRSTVTGLSTALSSGAIAWNNYTSQLRKASVAAKEAVSAVSKTAKTTPQQAGAGYGIPQLVNTAGYAAHYTTLGRDQFGMPIGANNPAQSAAYGAPQLANTAGYAGTLSKPGRDALGMAVPMTNAETKALRESNAELATQQKILQRNTSVWGAFSNSVQESSRDLWTMRRLSYDFEKWGRTMTASGLAAGAAIYSMADAYVNFDESATRAAMAMRLSVDLTDDLREGVKQASIAVARFTPEEIAEGMRLWAAGTGEVVQSQSQLNRLMEDTVDIQKLAAINNVEFSQTVDDVGGIMHEFGLQTEDVGRITSVLNFVAAESFANVNDLGQAFKMVGPLANELGVSFETTASAMAMLSDNNVKGTMAGRALRQLFLSMLDPTTKTTKSLNTLFNVNESLGESWRDLLFPNDEFVGLAETFDILAASTENMTDAQRAELAAILQNANAVPAFVTLLRNQNEARQYGINAMRAYEKVMTGVMDAEVVAYKQMYEATTGLPFSLEGAMAKMTNMWDEYEQSDSARMMRLKQRWHVAILDMGEPITEYLLPKLENLLDVMENLADFAQKNPGMLNTLLWGAGGLMALGLSLDALSKALSIWYLAGTLIPGFKAGAAALSAGGGAATVAAGTAGVATTGGTAGAIAGVLTSPVVIGAIMSALVIIASRTVNKENREEVERTLEKAPKEVRDEINRLFRRDVISGDLLSRGREAEELVARLKEEGSLGAAASYSTIVTAARIGVTEIPNLLREIKIELAKPTEISLQSQMLMESSVSGGTQASIHPPIRRVPEAYSEEQRAQLVSFYEYQQSRQKMVADFASKRKQIQSDYAEWVVQSEQNLTNRLGSLYTDFIQNRSRASEDLERNIAEASQSAYKQSEDAAKSHYENLRNMQIAHAQRMVDLLEARDVQGITKEMRSYETQTEQQNRSYAQQQQKSQADLADRIAKMKEDARLKELRDEEDYNAKVAEMEADAAAERIARKAENDAALAEHDQQRLEALQTLDDAFYEEIHGLENLLKDQYTQLDTDLDAFLLSYIGKWQTAGEAVALLVANLLPGGFSVLPEITNYGASSGAPSRAAGGYVGSGLYNLHNGEFVLSPDTTKELESRYGSLSQNTFKDTMGAQQFIFAPTFNGMGAQDKMWFRRTAEQVFDEKMATLQRRVR